MSDIDPYEIAHLQCGRCGLHWQLREWQIWSMRREGSVVVCGRCGWSATLKCERLSEATESDIARFTPEKLAEWADWLRSVPLPRYANVTSALYREAN